MPDATSNTIAARDTTRAPANRGGRRPCLCRAPCPCIRCPSRVKPCLDVSTFADNQLRYGAKLVRFTLHGLPGVPNLDAGLPLIAKGLEDPRHIALDARGNFYISDRGASHQVKMFAANGKAGYTSQRQSLWLMSISAKLP